ncbi:N-acetyltransferase family protein [Ruminococcaceae bacterium OttesenSCG-928-D13]|nr:N-acetyltransferase family protein [Ruminococcaceae bacterium OttesenSCG-928-D13]
MDGIIRRMQPGDIPAILDIYAWYVENTSVSFELEVPSLELFTRRVEAACADFPCLVHQQGETVLGYASASRHAERGAYRFGADTSVYLRHDHRGRGIAKELYDRLLALLKAQGYYNVYAILGMPNPRSARFHEKYGFTHTGTDRNAGFKLGAWHDVTRWELALRPPSPSPAEPLPAGKLPEALWEKALGGFQ